jgi:hypothetical protein
VGVARGAGVLVGMAVGEGSVLGAVLHPVKILIRMIRRIIILLVFFILHLSKLQFADGFIKFIIIDLFFVRLVEG